MRRFSIRTRLLVASALPSIALLVTCVIGAREWAYYIEDRVFLNIVSAQLEETKRAFENGQDLESPIGGGQLYIGMDKLPEEFSDTIRSLEPGVHELRDLGFREHSYNAFIGISDDQDPSNRLIVIIEDNTPKNIQAEPRVFLVLAIVVAFSLLICGFIVTRSIMKSVAILGTLPRTPADKPLPELPDDELGELGREWIQAKAELELSAARQRRFARNVSHELRTPISVASGAIELLYRHRVDRDTRENELLQRTTDALNEMKELIGIFMCIAEGTSSTIDEKESLERVAESVVSELRSAHDDLSDRLYIDLGVESSVNILRAPMAAIVRHMILNAYRHAPKSSEIRVRIEPGQVAVTNPVQSSEPVDPKHTGGMGLDILRELVESLDWSMEFGEIDGVFTCCVLINA